jgi:hypothetical protein
MKSSGRLSLASLLAVSDATRAENSGGDESVMIISQMRSKVDLKMIAVTWNALYDTTPQQ